MGNDEKLNVLMTGHSVEDAQLLSQLLAQDGFCLDWLNVVTEDALLDAIATRDWDVILSECHVPRLDVQTILQLLADRGLDVPLIVVSGTMGEEVAGSLMARGAYDFITKSNPFRLVPAIRRSRKEVNNRRHFDATQSALQKNDALFRAITSNLPGVVFQFYLTANHQTGFSYVSEASEMLLGLSPAQLMETPGLFPQLILTDDRASYHRCMLLSAQQLSTWDWEGCIHAHGDSDVKWINLRATPRKGLDGTALWDGMMINITRNKLVEREIVRSREQLAELTSYLQKVKEQERSRIAREIHDDIGGSLTAIKCELLPCVDRIVRDSGFYRQKAKSIEVLVDRVIDSTRRMALDLRPGILDCGIVAAVQWQAREFSDRTGIACTVSCRDDDISLDSDLAIAIFRVFQETLTNISKHAGASDVQVKLVELEGVIFLDVTDNGRGITIIEMEKQDSFGIRGMRERCQQLRGNFHISGDPESGTKVSITIPMGCPENWNGQVVGLKSKCRESQSLEWVKKRKKVSRF